MNIKKITILSLLTTIALTIFMLEAALPVIIPIPGIKLGLANIVTVFVLTRYGAKDALMVLLARIILASVFAGQMVYFIYSFCGGILCLVVMAVVNRILGNAYVYLTSVTGAIAHNLGQIMAAFFVLQMSGIFAYIPYLMISGVVTGLFTGLVCLFMGKYIPQEP